MEHHKFIDEVLAEPTSTFEKATKLRKVGVNLNTALHALCKRRKPNDGYSENRVELNDAPQQEENMNHKLDTDQQVFFYEQDFYVLSNFSAFRVKWQGVDFDTSEHAYHWEKFRGHIDAWNAAGSIAKQVCSAPSAHSAFKLAERYKPRRRPDWDDVKVEIMRGILKAKVDQHEYVRRKLLETGTRELVEDSWRDDFWGWGANKDGKNMLGRLWMEIREELRAASAALQHDGKLSTRKSE